jgi:hypothetical protein
VRLPEEEARLTSLEAFSISRACSRAFAVTSMPPSMRAISSIRSSGESSHTVVRVLRPSVSLLTRR